MITLYKADAKRLKRRYRIFTTLCCVPPAYIAAAMLATLLTASGKPEGLSQPGAVVGAFVLSLLAIGLIVVLGMLRMHDALLGHMAYTSAEFAENAVVLSRYMGNVLSFGEPKIRRQLYVLPPDAVGEVRSLPFGRVLCAAKEGRQFLMFEGRAKALDYTLERGSVRFVRQPHSSTGRLVTEAVFPAALGRPNRLRTSLARAVTAPVTAPPIVRTSPTELLLSPQAPRSAR